ncbi:MAG: alanine racemase [Fulvivirga sp.]|nr:alanine racemase [Fulvivirga sp.]
MKVKQPTLVLNAARCEQNIAAMVSKAEKLGLKLRPHFKTHQSAEVGKWFQNRGVEAITVSSIDMAAYFIEAGWQDINIAFPVNILRLDHLRALSQKAEITVLIDNMASAQFLDEQLDFSLHAFIEIDTGGNRSGVHHEQKEETLKLTEFIKHAERINLRGFYTHAGHTYNARSKGDIFKIADQSLAYFDSIRKHLDNEGEYEFCWGDTPSCSTMDDFKSINAISPGNFVFYDVMQYAIGACTLDQIAVAMYCPVVSKHVVNTEICIHGGAIHFSKDFINLNDQKVFGLLASKDSWKPIEDCYVRALSQEHGMIKVSREVYDQISVGDTLTILPVHSCLTAEAMGEYKTLSSEVITHFAQKNRDKARF